MPSQITLALSGLPRNASTLDVEKFIKRRLPNANPAVKPILYERNAGPGFTTVTIGGETKYAVRKACEKLQEDNSFYHPAKDGENAQIVIDSELLGMTVLAGKTESPDFDFVFVHGISGHAYKTFNCEASDHQRSCMWPRDLLPPFLDCAQECDRNCQYKGKHLRGRYSTFGYTARVIDPDNVPVTIGDTAESLLDEISLLRSRDNNEDQRPLFFACHSLGGLIVCQALVHALESEENEKIRLKMADGTCSVKGIAFFGTPFQGSRAASFIHSLSWLLGMVPINMSFIQHLKLKDDQVQHLVDKFEQLSGDLKLPLVIFYEQKKTRHFKILRFRVTEKQSAVHRFPESQTVRVPLFKDHRTIVKYLSQDATFRKIASQLQRLVHNVMVPKSGVEASLSIAKTFDTPPRAVIGSLAMVTGMTSEFQTEEQPGINAFSQQKGNVQEQYESSAQTPLSLLGNVERGQFTQKFSQFQRDIRAAYSPDPIDSEALENTCDWILNREKFNVWRDSSKSSILVLEGAAGVGKSVLAKSIVQRLKKDKSGITWRSEGNIGDQRKSHGFEDENKRDSEIEDISVTPTAKTETRSSPFILTFFSKRSGRDSPSNVLKHLMCQLDGLAGNVVSSSTRVFFGPFSQVQDVKFYWDLFIDICRRSSHQIYCVIDGLDECLKRVHRQPPSEFDENMVQFLKRMCSVTEQSNDGPSAKTLKILITTRHQIEIRHATEGKDILYQINDVDVIPGVEKFVRKKVQDLAASRSLPETQAEEIVQRILERSGPLYQWAVSFLELIQRPDYELGTRDGIVDVLDRFRLESYDDVYNEALQKVIPTNREAVSKIVRLLSCAREDLDLEEVQQALAIDPDDPSPLNFRGRMHNSLRFFIESNCGTLIRLNDRKSDRNEPRSPLVCFRHASVSEFLTRLSPEESPIYSCSPETGQQHHTEMARICLRYLLIWEKQDLSQQELNISGGDRLKALTQKSSFLVYAAYYWEEHVRLAGPSIKRHMSLVNEFLNLPSKQYGSDYLMANMMRDTIAGREITEDWSPMLPEIFIPTFNLVNVLETHIFPLPKFSTFQRVRRCVNSRLPRRLRARSTLRANPSNTLNVHLATSNGRTMLHSACESGAFEVTKYLLSCGATGLIRDLDGNTPFSLAVEEGHEKLAHALILDGAVLERRLDENNITSLHWACAHGMLSVASVLVKIGMPSDTVALEGWTPLLVAAGNGHVEIVRLLLLHGANPLAEKSGEISALHLAAKNGHLPVICALFDHDKNLSPSPLNDTRATPLFLAAENGHLETFKFLKSKQSEVEPTIRGWLPIHAAAYSGNSDLIELLKEHKNLYAENNRSRLPIHIASANGQIGAVEKFIELDVPIDIGCIDLDAPAGKEDQKPITPLYLAVLHGSVPLILLLIQKNANSHVQDTHGCNLLHIAASEGHREIFDFFVHEKKFDPLAEDLHKRTPFQLAARNGHKSIMEYYQKSRHLQDVINKSDEFGFTPLLEALSNEQKEAGLDLIKYGADVKHVAHSSRTSCALLAACFANEEIMENIRSKGGEMGLPDAFGNTSLHAAAQFGNLESMVFLSKLNLDVNAQNKHGRTPLMMASDRCRSEAVKLLLDWKADPRISDSFGMTPLDYTWGYAPIRELYEKEFPDLKPKTAEEQRSCFEGGLRKYLAENLQLLDESERGRVLSNVGYCFARLGKYEEARICGEQRLKKLSFGEPWASGFSCDSCVRQAIPGPVYNCAMCPDTLICSECFPNRAEDYQPRGCDMAHHFVEVGGEKWKKLLPGKVNEEETLEEWMDRQRRELGVVIENLDQAATS